MHQGNWPCSSCGGNITELPFEPRSTSGLLCRSCYAAGKKPGGGSNAQQEDSGETGAQQTEENAAPTNDGERKMFEGDWKCAECGGAITKLPFEPRSTNNLRCIDCFKKQKSQ